MKLRFLTILMLACAISSPVFADTLPHASDKASQPPDMGSVQEKRLSALVCFQAGVKIIDEHGIGNFTYGQDMLYGDMPDGSKLVVTGIDENAGVACKIIEYKK